MLTCMPGSRNILELPGATFHALVEIVTCWLRSSVLSRSAWKIR